DNPPPPPPATPQTPPQQVPHTMSTVKLHILKEGVIKALPPRTAEETLARERERKARTTLLMALPEDHLAKFHKMSDAKEMWNAIKSRFGGNDESKKMQKYILKQQFEGFTISNSEGLHKGYDRFQSLLSQLEIHGAGVSTEDANQKFLRSLPSSCTNSTNEVSTAYGASPSSSHNPQRENSSSYTDDLMYSFFANQSSGPQLDHEDLEQIDEFNLEEIDLKWQGVKMQGGEMQEAMGIKLKIMEEDLESRRNPMHCSDTEVISCSTKCVESYTKLKKLYDEQREQLSAASVEIQAYAQGLKKVEAQLVTHQNNQLWYEQKIRYMKIDLDDKTDVLTYHKKLLAEALKEKEDLKTKFENWQNSSKNLDDRALYDRFVIADGMHAVPPHMTGNYMPSGPDIEIDESQFTYGPKQPQSSESDTRSSDFDSCESNSSVETPNCMPEPVVIKPKVRSTPKVWTDAPIIEEYESDIDDDCVSTPLKEQEQPSFACVNTAKHVKSPTETIPDHNTCSHSPNVNKKDRNGSTTKRMGLGYGFTRKACYVCGSFSHLIRDCNFHKNRMAKQVELNKRVSKGTGPKENRPVWNNMKRMNHQNQFIPTALLTRTGKLQVNTTKTSGTNKVSIAIQNTNCQAVPTSAGRKVNTVKPKVNDNRPKTTFHKVHSYFKRPFQRTTATKTNFSNQKVNTAGDKAVSAVGEKGKTVVKASADCTWRPKRALKNKGIVDSGCSRHMTGNKAYLVDYQDYNGGPVAFGGSKGQITGRGKIRIGKLDFDDVCFVKELQQFNLFSVSQMFDKKNKVLFNDTECLVLSLNFKLSDENQVLLRVPRQHNIYSFNLENIVPSGELACLIAKTTINESNKWHMRLGHVNFKNLNKLVKGNLVRGLPSKIFQNDHTCVACQKGKQHKASYKAKVVSSISQPLQLLHMDLFGPTSVRSLNHKTYYLVITDDFSRFSWVFFLRTKDETSGILKDFIRQIENQLNLKVKTIRSDNGTEFKNREMIEFCRSKGIKREYSNARTPQQNRVAERKNRTLIKAARTMLADSFLPNTFWAEAFSTACYVLNRAFRVYNLETKRVEENLHIKFLENKPNVAGKGPIWLFDLDYLTDSMNYQLVTAENTTNKTAGPKEVNHSAGTQNTTVAGNSEIEDILAQEYCVLPMWSSYSSTLKSSEVKIGGEKPNEDVK
ncbi:putative ribonuclease H-like domain-containing protein, partial [Tanacetum coccineum]